MKSHPVRLADHLFNLGNTNDHYMSSDQTAERIIADPQAHIDALVETGVLRHWPDSHHSDVYTVVPPTCPRCGK